MTKFLCNCDWDTEPCHQAAEVKVVDAHGTDLYLCHSHHDERDIVDGDQISVLPAHGSGNPIDRWVVDCFAVIHRNPDGTFEMTMEWDRIEPQDKSNEETDDPLEIGATFVDAYLKTMVMEGKPFSNQRLVSNYLPPGWVEPIDPALKARQDAIADLKRSLADLS